MIQVLPNEYPAATADGRWLWVVDLDDGWEGYVHIDCEALCDVDGCCLLCGAPSPSSDYQGSKNNGGSIWEHTH